MWSLPRTAIIPASRKSGYSGGTWQLVGPPSNDDGKSKSSTLSQLPLPPTTRILESVREMALNERPVRDILRLSSLRTCLIVVALQWAIPLTAQAIVAHVGVKRAVLVQRAVLDVGGEGVPRA